MRAGAAGASCTAWVARAVLAARAETSMSATGTRATDSGASGQRPPLARFIVLYSLLYAAFGAASPFLPAVIEERGIPPELIGVLFGAGTAIRLLSASAAGRIADRTQALRLTLAVCAFGAALAALGYL